MTTQNDGMAAGEFKDDSWIAEIQQAIREADAGEFATDAAVAALRAKWKCDEKRAEALSRTPAPSLVGKSARITQVSTHGSLAIAVVGR